MQNRTGVLDKGVVRFALGMGTLVLSSWDQEGALRGCIASRIGCWAAEGQGDCWHGGMTRESGFEWRTATTGEPSGKAEEGAEATSCHCGSLKHDIYIKAAPFLWALWEFWLGGRVCGLIGLSRGNSGLTF